MSAPYLLVTAFWALAAAQWPLRGLVTPWDSKNQFYAFFRFMAGAVHDGSSPFWNPYHYAGHPSVADPQSLIFSPGFALWALVDPKPSLYAFDLMVFAHLLIGGLALVRHGRLLGWPAAARLLAAMVFMVGGCAASRLNHTGIIIAYGLFPLASLWLDRVWDAGSWRAAAGLGAATALIALGRSQVSLLLCLALAGLLIARAAAPGQWRRVLQRLPALVFSGAIMVALTAIPFLLTFQFADFSNRPEITPELAARSSLYPANLATFFSPNVFGSLLPASIGDWSPGYTTLPDTDSTDRSFNYLFAGSLVALLLVWHGLAGGRALRRGARSYLALGAFAALYALGRFTPLYGFMMAHFAGIDYFRRPVDALFLLVIALAYLSGFLASAHIREGAPALPRWRLAAALACALAPLAAGVWFSSLSAKGWASAWEVAKTIPIYAGLTALLALPRSQRTRAAGAAFAVALTAGELITRNVAIPMNAEPRSYYAMLEEPTPEAQAIIDAVTADAKRRAEPGVRPRVEVVGLGGPWQNAAMIYGIEATNGYNPLRIGPYDRLVEPGESPFTALHRRFPGSFSGYDCLLGKLLGLEYVVLGRPIEEMPNLARRGAAEAIMSGPRVWIYRLAGVAPRVALDTRVRVADAADMIDAGRFPASIPEAEVLVDTDDTLSQMYRAAASGDPGTAAIISWRPDRIEIAVNAGAPAILTLRDPWYPGWVAEVDGVRQPVLRTDVLFRGVETPAGAHKIVFTYRPLSLENLWDAAQGLWGGGE